jgi:hypothetical protein
LGDLINVRPRKLQHPDGGILRSSIIISIWPFLAVASMIAQSSSQQKPEPPETWRASSGNFGAMMVFTDDPEKFMEEWSKPPESVPQISSVESARRGDTVVAFLFFSGCKARKGNCDSDVDFKLLRPDGSVYAEHSGVELWKGKPPPPGGSVQLSVANLGFRVEPQDPLGNYKLKAVVHDRNAKLDLSLERQIEVLPAK